MNRYKFSLQNLSLVLGMSLITCSAGADDTINYYQLGGLNTQATFVLQSSFFTDPTHNGLGFNFDQNNAFLLDRNISYHDSVPDAAVEHLQINSTNGSLITFRRATNDECATISCGNSNFPPTNPQIQTRSLEINNATLQLDGVEILFGPTHPSRPQNNTSSIDLNNGTLMTPVNPGVNVAADMNFSLNALSGDNVINGHINYGVLSNHIQVNDAASLKFLYSSPNIQSDASVNVEGGKLIFEQSDAVINNVSGGFTVMSGELELKGSGTSLTVNDIAIDNSHLLIGDNTLIDSSAITLKNSTAEVKQGGRIDTTALHSYGQTNIVSRGGAITADFITVFDGQLEIDTDSSLGGLGATIHSGSKFVFINSANPGGVHLNYSTLKVDGELQAAGVINAPLLFRVGSTGSLTPESSTQDRTEMLINGNLEINGGALNVGVDPLATPTPTIFVNDIFVVNGDVVGTGAVINFDLGAGVANMHSDVFDQKEFTVLTAAGNLSLPTTIVPGSSMPALLSYSVTDLDSVAGNDISVVITELPVSEILRHPSVSKASHSSSTSTTVVVEPSSGNTVTTTTVITPQASGSAHQTVTTNVIDPVGAPVSSESFTVVMPAVTGTDNTPSSARLLINAAEGGNTNIQNQLSMLTNAQAGEHINSIHAEPYSSYMTVSLEHSDMVMNTVLNNAASSGYVSNGRTKEIEEKNTRKRFWMDVSYNEGEVDGDDGLGDFDYTLSSLTIGQDLVVSGDRALGLYFSFGTQEIDEHDRAIEDFDGDVYHVGMYLNLSNLGGWDLRGVLGYAYGDNSSKRRVLLGNSSETPTADFNSHSAYVGVKGTVTGYQNDWMTLSPELGFNYTYYMQESFKESGDPDLSLRLDSADAQAIIASAGLNARFASLSDSMSIYPLAFVRYEYDFYANANNEHEIDAALVAHPDYKQTFIGQNRGEHAIITGIGLGSDVSNALQVNGSFVHSENSNGREWGAGLNVEYFW
jgi:uncharacterized protein YhjY with autotransporter beta-barrel domain